MMTQYRALILPLILALGACQQEKTAETQKAAGGEILESSVSDAMVPLDTVRSQPPLAPKTASDGTGKDDRSADPGLRRSRAADEAASAKGEEKSVPAAAAQPDAGEAATPDGE